MIRRSLPFFLLVAILACERREPQSAAAPPANEIWLSEAQDRQAHLVFAIVEERPVGGELRVPGRLAFDDRRIAHVFSPVSGRVTALVADLGQRVHAGATLALLDSPDLGAALADAHKAQAALVAAEKEFGRQKELFEAHAGAQRDLEAAEAVYRNALAERDRAQQRAEMLGGGGRLTQRYRLASPIGGEVIARTATPGMEVQGQYGGGSAVELYTVGELDRLWLLIDLPEMDVFRVKAGDAVRFTMSGAPDLVFETKVDWISGALDPATRTARLRCVVPNPGRRLRPEMLAQARIQAEPRKALAIPRTAVLRLGALTYAFVDLGQNSAPGRRLERRPIQVREQEGGDLVPVVAGLKLGERVVTAGSISLAGFE